MKLIFDNTEASVHDSCEISIRVYKLIFAIQNESMNDEETEELSLDQEKQEEYYEDDNLLQEILQFMMNQDAMDIHSDSEDYESPEQVDYRGDFKPELVQLLENMRSSDGDNTEFSQENMSPEMLKELLEQMENLDMDASESPIDSSTDMIAESVKLIENSYRDLNIAFANEIDDLLKEKDINAKEVIKLANEHPRVNVLNPGIASNFAFGGVNSRP